MMKLKSFLLSAGIFVCASVSAMAASRNVYRVKVSSFNLMGNFELESVNNDMDNDLLFSRDRCYFSSNNTQKFKLLSEKIIGLSNDEFQKANESLRKLDEYGMYLAYEDEKDCAQPITKEYKKKLLKFNKCMEELLDLLKSKLI